MTVQSKGPFVETSNTDLGLIGPNSSFYECLDRLVRVELLQYIYKYCMLFEMETESRSIWQGFSCFEVQELHDKRKGAVWKTRKS